MTLILSYSRQLKPLEICMYQQNHFAHPQRSKGLAMSSLGVLGRMFDGGMGEERGADVAHGAAGGVAQP